MKKQIPTFEEILVQLSEKLNELETLRLEGEKQAAKTQTKVLIALGLGIIAVVLGFQISRTWGVTFSVLSVSTVIYFSSSIDLSYKSKIKYQLISSILNAFDEELYYFPDHYINKSLIQKGSLFRFGLESKVSGADYIEGYYNGSYIRYSRIRVMVKAEHENKDTFGSYFVLSFNKHFKKQTFVLQDKLEKKLGYVGQKIQNSMSFGKLVKLEHAEFERRFAVYSEDQVEARYLLSTNFMEKLIAEDNKSDGVVCSFVDGDIHIYVKGRKEPFNYARGKSVINEKVIYSFYESIYQIFSFIDSLDLNKKLWSKQ